MGIWELLKKVNKTAYRSQEGNNIYQVDPYDGPYVRVRIVGQNNRVVIRKLDGLSKGHLRISVFGDDCSVEIDEGLFVRTRLNIVLGGRSFLGGRVRKTCLKVGSRVQIEDVTIVTNDSEGKIEIGNNCRIGCGRTVLNKD